jgi:hypothetical protein
VEHKKGISIKAISKKHSPNKGYLKSGPKGLKILVSLVRFRSGAPLIIHDNLSDCEGLRKRRGGDSVLHLLRF